MEDDRCWSCILLNKPCDQGEICGYCLDREDESSELPCSRFVIGEDIETAFPRVNQISEGVWTFRTPTNRMYKLVIGTDGLDPKKVQEKTVLDLPYFIHRYINFDPIDAGEDRGLPIGTAYSMFLTQFAQLDIRWGTMYEPLTNEILEDAANYQRDSCTDKDFVTDDDLLILIALRCLTVSRDWATLSFSIPEPDIDVDGDDEYGSDWEARFEHLSLRPSISISKIPARDELPSSTQPREDSLFFLLEKAFRIAQKLLFQGKPVNWVAVWHTIVVLELAICNLEYIRDFTSALKEGCEALRFELRDLCRLFLHCVGDLHPFHNDLDEIWFGMLVDHDEHATDSYNTANGTWITNNTHFDLEDRIRSQKGDLDSFLFNIDRFCHGMV